MPSSTCSAVKLAWTPELDYLLCAADTALIHAQRLAEWCGHAPILEEDIALSNIALDHLGQARALLTLAGQMEGQGHDEDRLAFLRDESDFRNLTLAELPLRKGGGDFADTQLRNLLLASWFKGLWQRWQASPNAELAAIAGKAIKEARYHQAHAADWVIRLGDGTAESSARMAAALQRAWPCVAELFELPACALGPASAELRDDWQREVAGVLADAKLAMPVDTSFRSTGHRGLHSEHFGYLLAEMQHLQRAYPGGVW